MSEQVMPTNSSFAPLGQAFRVRVEMESDWHIGSGTGRPGDVDRLVRRNRGLPYVPAKSLTGIWRDACEQAALGLDDGKPGPWSAWVSFLFGQQAGHPGEELKEVRAEAIEHPRPAALSVRSAQLPRDLVRALNGKDGAREAVTFIKPGVSVDSRSGRAKTDHLRFEEMARVGAILSAEGEIDWSSCQDDEEGEDQKRAATALLLAGARLVERLGGKRRRGAGRCKMTIDNRDELNAVWDWIDAQKLEQVPSPPPLRDAGVGTSLKQSTPGGWHRIQLTLTTKSPVIVSTRTVGNLVETADHMPGTYLLAIVRRSLQPLGVDVNSAIVNGDLIVTNATRDVGNERGRPIPFSIFHKKLDGGLKEGKGVYNRFCDAIDLERDPQVKGQRGGYVGPTGVDTIPAYQSVKLGVECHNVVKDQLQRPHEDVGGVYSYQAIGGGQVLRAELRIKESLALTLADKKVDWFADLNGTHRVGRSKKDDYGVVKLTAIDIKEEPVQTELCDGRLTVWLLSDLLLRDERLRPSASVVRLREQLERTFRSLTGQRVALSVRAAREEKLLSNMTRQHRMDTWHVGWGLPRPSLAGLAAGSCVVFDVSEGNLTANTLTQVAQEGLGERRAEGYGQLSFNDPLLESKLKGKNRADDKPPSKLEIERDELRGRAYLIQRQSDAFGYGRVIEREAIRREIQRRAITLGNRTEKRTEALGIAVKDRKSRPPMSQLGALRSVASRLLSVDDKKDIVGWLAHLEETPNRFDKWPNEAKGKRTGNDQRSGLNRIRALIEERDRVWVLLSSLDETDTKPFDWSSLVITETGEDDLKTELWAEAVRAVVDACVRAQKRETEKTPGIGGKGNGAQN